MAWSVHGPPWPGGDYKTGRYNEGERDLNRDFPTWRQVNQTRESLYSGRQPETQAMMDLIFGQVTTTSQPRDLNPSPAMGSLRKLPRRRGGGFLPL